MDSQCESITAICATKPPQAVRSNMLQGLEHHAAGIDGILEPDIVANFCIKAIESNEFLVLPHPKVLDYMRAKTADYDRWLKGMRNLRRKHDTR